MKPADLADQLDRDGFAIRPGVIDEATVENILAAVARGSTSGLQREGETYGMRDLLRGVPEVRKLAGSPALLDLADTVLGPGAFAVRGLWFDKTDGANWGVPWHQDTTIAVLRKNEANGFGPWTVKAGIDHVRPPEAVLARMVTIRVHLDDCDADNGPLRVIPGSHRQGRLDARTTADRLSGTTEITCLVPRGGVVLMRPLLLHASSAATAPRRRRVVHLEYAATSLADGLDWFECVGREDR